MGHGGAEEEGRVLAVTVPEGLRESVGVRVPLGQRETVEEAEGLEHGVGVSVMLLLVHKVEDWVDERDVENVAEGDPELLLHVVTVSVPQAEEDPLREGVALVEGEAEAVKQAVGLPLPLPPTPAVGEEDEKAEAEREGDKEGLPEKLLVEQAVEESVTDALGDCEGVRDTEEVREGLSEVLRVGQVLGLEVVQAVNDASWERVGLLEPLKLDVSVEQRETDGVGEEL